MTYKYDILFDKIIAAVASDGAIVDRMKIVIDECARQRPHDDWEKLSEIDFDADLPALDSWLQNAYATPADAMTRAGLWFGLFNPVNEAGQASADIYVGVAPEYDGSSIDWACDIEALEPGNYLGSRVLQKIYASAYDSRSGLANDAEYPLVLAYGGIMARSVLAKKSLPAGLHGIKGAVVGFDSGDSLFLGEFVASTFRSNVRAG
jgi:hypothetical protein